MSLLLHYLVVPLISSTAQDMKGGVPLRKYLPLLHDLLVNKSCPLNSPTHIFHFTRYEGWCPAEEGSATAFT